MNTRWQYEVVEIKLGMLGGLKAADMKETLARMGAQGWELVNITHPTPMTPMLAVFKKPA